MADADAFPTPKPCTFVIDKFVLSDKDLTAHLLV